MSVSRPLRRGRACMACRFLKIKCDGVKPVCGPCTKTPKDDDCEYQDGPSRSRTKVLEDTVARLEARLQELEHPEDNTPPVTLYDPYAGPPPPPPQLSLPPPTQPHFRSLPNSPFAQVPRLLTSGSSSSTESSQIRTPFSPASATRSVPPYGTSSASGTSPLGLFESRLPSSRESPELTSPASTASSVDYEALDYPLLQKFLDHASEFGFFLDTERLVALHHHTPALLYAMYLLGAHLSSDPRNEQLFKFKALYHAATALGSPPQSLAFLFSHTLQAQVLLAYYFFRTGALLSARAHAATAFALALGGGLHQIRSARPGPPPGIAIDAETGHALIPLPPAHDAIEEGERINAFWAIYSLQKNLSMALEPAAGAASIFETTGPGGLQIDTPWPLEMDEYKRGLLGPGIRGDGTVLNYLQIPPGHAQPTDSLATQTAKACILLHRTAYIRSQWPRTPDVSQRDVQFLSGAWTAADGLIRDLRAQLPPVLVPAPHDRVDVDVRTRTRKLLLTHSMLNAATIKLHGMFMASDSRSRECCLGAASDMLRFGGMQELQALGCLNPIIGTLWTTAFYVFVSELRRINAISGWRTAEGEKEAQDAHDAVQDGLRALGTFAGQSLLMRYELLQAKEAAADIVQNLPNLNQ
ncbi:hypothetical protein FB45DRAFT_998840 [Roridomyces roridus]|uniref:Zn(2)-C6 fungal-type domain-containing protein n=1 Tax=Roridomyces roridus TaxID=1738132 RepID=A0AAD7CGW1_9AGAR|nr:hypothetical protein FB45DRAFT_998840 [Roridomyces roridus]